MSMNARRAAVHQISTRTPKPIEPPHEPVTDLFGVNVFNDRVQRQRLPKAVYSKLRRTSRAGHELDPDIADAVASALRDWAVERGATHFTHWFQPMTGLTAEKHDSFISLTDDDRIITEFSGESLIRGEPDASSFPSGGLRTTFEARGYTAWDPTSPAFLKEGPKGLTLCIPTAFCSWTGEALDKKTPLLRSDEAINRAAVRLIRLLGNDRVSQVWSTVGCEQEYFLVDRVLADLRPDILASGRTLFGAEPPKGQELDDHYFGAISERALAFMQDLDRELWKLGIPSKTRHNEVAPGQFELAPIFSKATVATDQNMLTMEVMRVVAGRHGLKCLLHEKPFAGLNGSGKHTNWSLADDDGNNLLEPGETPHQNLQFMLFLTAIIRAVDLHADLLRVTIASAGNDHRLGANEAPPAIVSIFLGRQLEDVVAVLLGESGSDGGSNGDRLRLGVTTLPALPRDLGDRNRTSPFAFTGNKFEFRAVGSSQSVAYPATILNTIVADSLEHIADEIEKASKSTGDVNAAAAHAVSAALAEHRRVLFSGDNYSKEWEDEAERRGLPNLRGTPTALARLTDEKNLALLEQRGVLSRRETESRRLVLLENYISAIRIEAVSTRQLAKTSILAAAFAYQKQLASTAHNTLQANAGCDVVPLLELLNEVNDLTGKLKRRGDDLAQTIAALSDVSGELAKAEHCRHQIIPAQDAVRDAVDRLEDVVDDELWPFPKYRELLFLN